MNFEIRQALLSCVAQNSGAEVENSEPFVFQHATVSRLEVSVQISIMIEPPHGRPRENDVSTAGFPQAFYFPDRLLVVLGATPVLPVDFEKWQASAMCIVAEPGLQFVHKNIGGAGGNDLTDLRQRPIFAARFDIRHRQS